MHSINVCTTSEKIYDKKNMANWKKKYMYTIIVRFVMYNNIFIYSALKRKIKKKSEIKLWSMICHGFFIKTPFFPLHNNTHSINLKIIFSSNFKCKPHCTSIWVMFHNHFLGVKRKTSEKKKKIQFLKNIFKGGFNDWFIQIMREFTIKQPIECYNLEYLIWNK